MTPEIAVKKLEQRILYLESEVEALRALIATEPPAGRSGSEEVAADSLRAPRTNGTHSSPDSAEDGSTGDADRIVEWFKERNVAVEVGEETAADRVFDRLAEYLGDHYPELHRVAGGIRWTILEGKNTAFALNKLSAREKKHILEFTEMLNDRAFLTYFNYNESGGRLSFRANDDQRLVQFISGHWLERYVLAKGRKCFEGASLDFTSARNIHVRGGKAAGSFEMDVVFLVAGEPIWVECKSREFRRDIDKYAQRAVSLGIPLDRTIVAVQSFDNEQTQEAAADIPGLYGLSVTDTSGLTKRFEEIADTEAQARKTGVDWGGDDQDALVARLTDYLVQSQLSPQPESRKVLLAALLEAGKEGLPATTGELRERMRAGVAASLASGVHPVLVAVRRGGGLLDDLGMPNKDPSLSAEVAGLAADDVAGLEALCRRGYEEAVERKMPEVASRPDFAEVFERVVGSGDSS